MAGTNTLPSPSDILRETGIATLTSKLAPLAMFCSQIPVDTNGPKRPLEVGICTAASTTLVNPTNWETGDSTVEARTITISQLSQSFHISSADLQSQISFKSLVRKNADAFALKIWQTVAAVLTEVNFTAQTLASGGLADLVNAIPKSASRFALLDTGLYVGVMPERLIGGPAQHPAFANGVFEISDWTGAGSGVRGFAGDPAALIVASGPPLSPKGVEKFISQETVTLTGIEIPVMLTSWTVPGTRFTWMSFDTMTGAVKGDASAAVLLK